MSQKKLQGSVKLDGKRILEHAFPFAIQVVSPVFLGPALKGSSLDLAPSLMSIYDSYANTNRSYSSCEESLHSSGVADHTGKPQKGKHGYYLQDVNKNIPQNVARDSSGSDEEVVIDMEPAMASGRGDVSLTIPDRGDSSSSRTFTVPVTPPDVPCANLSMDNYSDAKKRPLSISSTSSSTSSTSSLPRHQRKKIATNVGAPISSLVGGVEDSPCHISNVTMELHDVDEADASEEEDGPKTRTDHSRSQDGDVASNQFHLDLNKSREMPADTASLKSACRLSVDTSSSGYVENVIAEIIESERTYACDLKDIIQGYLEHILHMDDVGISEEDMGALFGNIEAIYEFNLNFLKSLDSCQADQVKIAQCFVEKNDGFLIYSDYCTNYPRSVEVLTKCMREPALADMFKQQQLHLNHGLPLGSYLLKPVQRILKYHLFLENIVSSHDNSIGGKDEFYKALASMTKIAQHINEMKRKHEHTVRIQEIQSVLYGWDGADLTTLGEMAMEDTFRMCGAKAHRSVFLFEKGILIAKKREDGNLLVKGFILCSNLMLVESIPKEPLSFHVIPFDNPRMQHTIQARSLEQKRKWCFQIKKCIIENYSAVIPDKAKEIVMNLLGKSREEEGLNDSNLENIDPGKKQHTAPEYLEKRRGRRRSTSLIPDFGLLKSKRNAKKLEGGSPKSSPRQRRRSDVTSFLPRVSPKKPPKDLLHEAVLESDSEDTPEVVLRDQNKRGRRQHRPLSRSLESLNLEMSLCASGASLGDESSCKQDVPATSYDDASSRAKRMSQVLTDEGLEAQLKQDSSIGWDQDMVSSVLAGVKESVGPGATADVKDAVDDGYCNVMFQENSGGKSSCDDSAPYSNVLCRIAEDGTSSMHILEDTYGDYIKISRTSTSSNSESKDSANYVRLYKKTEVISNQYAKNTDDIDDIAPTEGASSKDAIPSVSATPNGTGIPDTGADDKLQDSVYDSVSFADVSQHQKLAGCSASDADASGVLKLSSPVHETCRPISSESVASDEAGASEMDPWIRREVISSSPSCEQSAIFNAGKPPLSRKPTPNLKPGGLRMNSSFSHFDRPRPSRDGPKPRLFKSNSFSSGDDLDQCGTKGQHGHRRGRADVLVFSNKNAFLASPDDRSVKLDLDITRAISRYATPPRDMGPEDVIRDVEESKRRGKVVTRYATPPRTIMDANKLGVLNDEAVIENTYSCEFGSEVREAYDKLTEMQTLNSPDDSRRATISYNGSPIQSDMWSDIENYLKQSAVSSVEDVGRPPDSPKRPGSFHGAMHHSISPGTCPSSPNPTSPLSSPSSVLSNESIVGSLKNVVLNLTSRITGRSSSRGASASVEGSPTRCPKSSSISAIDSCRDDSSSKSYKLSKDNGKRKEKRHRFVYQLARAYSDRVKQRAKTIKKRGKSLEDSEMFSTSTKELNNLLQENKQGGNSIGARIADEPCTSVIGTYTLPRLRRKVKRNQGIEEEPSNEDSEIIGAEGDDRRPQSAASSSDQDSGCLDDLTCPVSKPCKPVQDLSTQDFVSLAMTTDSLEHSCEGSEGNDPDSLSMDYYYENKFLDDIEGDFSEDMFGEGLMYEEEGSPKILQSGHPVKFSIKEAVQMIEKKSQPKPMNKTEIKRGEKAQGIQDILKSLEKGQAEESSTKVGERSEDHSQVKSIRDRTRELVECARLTRIRQDSCTVVEEVSHSQGCSDSSGTSTPTRRGWYTYRR